MTSPRVPLLFDSVSANTGDIAMGIAARQLLARRGIEGDILSPFDPRSPEPTIIGGGELIRVPGDEFYDAFRRTGRHILNAVGVWTNATDLDYLRDYAYVSARTTREAEVLRSAVPDATVLPCATTAMTSDDIDVPGIAPGEPVVGVHLAPHALRMIEDLVPIIDAIPLKKVFIPFTHYNGDHSFMKHLPFDRRNSVTLPLLKPLELHAVIRKMTYMIATSLHASLFAYAQNIPFISIAQKKVRFYFDDRGLSHLVVTTASELSSRIREYTEELPDFSALVAADLTAIDRAWDTYASLIGRGSGPLKPHPKAAAHEERAREIIAAQAMRVIEDRDLAVAQVEARRLRLAREPNPLRPAIALVRSLRSRRR